MCQDWSQTWLQITDHVGGENIQFGCHRSALISDLKLAPVGHQEHLGNPPQASYRPLWRQTRSTGDTGRQLFLLISKARFLVAKIWNMKHPIRSRWWYFEAEMIQDLAMKPLLTSDQDADPRCENDPGSLWPTIWHTPCVYYTLCPLFIPYPLFTSYRTHFSYPVHFS